MPVLQYCTADTVQADRRIFEDFEGSEQYSVMKLKKNFNYTFGYEWYVSRGDMARRRGQHVASLPANGEFSVTVTPSPKWTNMAYRSMFDFKNQCALCFNITDDANQSIASAPTSRCSKSSFTSYRGL